MTLMGPWANTWLSPRCHECEMDERVLPHWADSHIHTRL
jgi:hypothetical protein